ncbi:hypothetical protein SLS57_002368 [Botryosphaeria dothidea]
MSSVPPPDHRPAKRIRQACEPCRRKKSRCPGERPNCSHCSRLGQNCYYATDHPAANDDSTAAGSTNRESLDRHGSVSESTDGANATPFAQPGPWVHGNTHRASSLSSLALDLAESAGLSTDCHASYHDPSHEERRRCFWSILFLKKLHGGNCGNYSISADESLPKFPTSTKKPPAPDFNSDPRTLQEGPRDEGITAYVIQLSEYWHKTLRYARRRANPGVHYPWSAESEYSKIMVSMMEMESHMPYKHRFRSSKFADRPTEELEKQRDYWCPWLFSQMIYHTIMCLLNHPLILSLRLRNFRVSIPEIFLQHTADLIASHTDWVIHFMDILEEKSFRVTDPFIGHCVAVVATIYLQQSYADDAGIRTEKRNNFLKCLNFVRKLGAYWPHVAQIASKLQNFEATVSASYRDSAATPSPDATPPQTSVFIDLTTFWEILEAVFTSDGAADSGGSLFGSTLWPPHRSTASAGPRGEVVSSRLLPEPTYPRGDGGVARNNSVSTPTMVQGAGLSGGGAVGRGGGGDVMDSMALGMGDNDELAVLAQSYFAQGQDFVRGVDDWWTFGQ